MIIWVIKISLYSSSVYFSHLFLVYSALLNLKIPKSQSDLEKKEQSLRPWLLTSNILESYSNQNRMICFWHKNRHIDQQSRTEKLERNHTHILLVSLWKGSHLSIQWGKDKVFKMALRKLDSPLKKWNCVPVFYNTQKSTKKGLKSWTKDSKWLNP